jgi:DNA repair protein RadC
MNETQETMGAALATPSRQVARERGRGAAIIRHALTTGASSLDDAELLRLVLGNRAGFSRSQLATLLLAEPLELVQNGLLSARAAARLAGAIELGRRLAARRLELPRLPTASAVWNWVRPALVGLRRETFRVLCLDARSRLLREVVASEGSVDSCHVDPREIFAPAIACRASAVILVHNHPSGDPEPSLHDVQLTQQLRQAGELLCIRVIDHVVVSESGFVSMMQRQLLERPSGEGSPRLQ